MSLPEEPLPAPELEGQPEPLPRIAETWTASEAEARVAQLFTPSDEVIAAQRPALREAVDRALATAVSEHERRSLLLAGGILDWQLFNPGGPLPPGLVISTNQTGKQYITYDTRELFGYECATAAHKRLESLGLKEVAAAVQADLEDRQHEIQGGIETVLRETPEYTLLQSFDIQLPPEFREHPLPSKIKDEREEQIKTSARREYRVQYRDPLWTVESARRSMLRGIQYLDLETTPQREEEGVDKDAIAYARKYFMARIVKAFEAEGGRGLRGFEMGPHNALVPMYEEAPPEHYDNYHSIFIAIEEVIEELEPAGDAGRAQVMESFLVDYLEKILVTRRPATPYAQLIEEVVAEAVEVLSSNWHRIDDFAYFDEDDLTHQGRYAAVGEYVARDALLDCSDEHTRCTFFDSMAGPGFVGEARLRRLEGTIIGNGARIPPEASGRLILGQQFDSNVPESSSEEEFAISLHGDDFIYDDPSIPGYRLVSRRGYRYGFAKDEAGEPYAPAEVVLADEQRETLAAKYEELGLHSWAAGLRHAQGLTADDLRNLLQAHVEYIVPGEDSTLPNVFTAESLDDFARFVTGGKLLGQCTGFSNFDQLSLDAIFGPGSASVVSGYTLVPGVITAVKHQQSVFVHNGRIYIREVTPPSGRPAQVDTFGGGMVVRPSPRAIRSSDLSRPETPPVHIDEAVQRRRRLEAAYTALETNLSILFRIPDKQALMERIVQLSEDDPIRRVYEATRAAVRGELTPAQIEALKRYLELYAAADPALRKETGLASYDPRIVAWLHTAVEQVHHNMSLANTALASNHAPTDSPEAQAGGESTIAGIKMAIEAALALLPNEEVVIARDGVAAALAHLQTVLQDSEDSQAQGVLAQLAAAREALQRTTGALGHSDEAYRRYIEGL